MRRKGSRFAKILSPPVAYFPRHFCRSKTICIADCVRHPKVVRVLALWGGYSRDEANSPGERPGKTCRAAINPRFHGCDGRPYVPELVDRSYRSGDGREPWLPASTLYPLNLGEDPTRAAHYSAVRPECELELRWPGLMRPRLPWACGGRERVGGWDLYLWASQGIETAMRRLREATK